MRRPRRSRAFASSAASSSASDVTREELLERYHAVVYAVGTSLDNRLGVPGEDRRGSVAATEFVAWYNGHPDFADHEFDLSCARAVVVGNGNVAIDVARMLVLDPDELAPTDTADHAIGSFGLASVDEVVILGRRGPAQAAFTNPELRELGELKRADIVDRPGRARARQPSAAWLASRRRVANGEAQRRDHAASSRSARRRVSRTGSRCASCARRWSSSATRRGWRGHGAARRSQPDRGR